MVTVKEMNVGNRQMFGSNPMEEETVKDTKVVLNLNNITIDSTINDANGRKWTNSKT